MAIKAVAFDIDGTLYPNRRMKLMSFPFLCSHLSLILKFSKVRKELRTIDPIDDFRSQQTSLMAKELNCSPEKAEQTINRIIYKNWEKVFRFVKPFSGLRNMMQELKDAGLKIAVLSDFPVGNKLSYFNIEDGWDLAMSSEDTGYLKPHAAPFLSLAEKLSCKPEEVIYVGNSFEYDVKGASAAGMKTVYINWKGKQIPEADLTIRNYKNFYKKIQSLMGQE